MPAVLEELELQAVGDVSQRIGRGKHTTRNVTLLELGGGALLADTPGFNQPVLGMPATELGEAFPEVRQRLQEGRWVRQEAERRGAPCTGVAWWSWVRCNCGRGVRRGGDMASLAGKGSLWSACMPAAKFCPPQRARKQVLCGRDSRWWVCAVVGSLHLLCSSATTSQGLLVLSPNFRNPLP